MSTIIGEKSTKFRSFQSGYRGLQLILTKKKDHVVLLEVFQVNCPRMFYEMQFQRQLTIYNKYKDEGVRVLGLATAFEDFDKNTLENLKMLAGNRRGNWRDKGCTFNAW